VFYLGDLFPSEYHLVSADVAKSLSGTSSAPVVASLDIAAYNKKLIQIANYPSSTTAHLTASSSATSDASSSSLAAIAPRHPWPVKTVYPNAGALLPFNRIVAYYGNFYSTSMGVLGQYPPAEALSRLQAAAAQWQAADPSTPVIPAIDYIAVTAQGSPGADGKYRLRMPDSQIQQAISMAAEINGIVILDVQVGDSTLQAELPLLAQYLKLPQVHLAIDPEFAMHNGEKPGTVIGTFDATDINYAANFLAGLVKANNLPPKILVVHRFTEDMVTHYKNITPLPEVEIVMDMDGWGPPAKKVGTYTNFIAGEPVQFTGFKLFYKNDIKSGIPMMTPEQVLKLTPQPVFIQYQ